MKAKKSRISTDLDDILSYGSKELGVSKVAYSRIVARSGMLYPEEIMNRRGKKKERKIDGRLQIKI